MEEKKSLWDEVKQIDLVDYLIHWVINRRCEIATIGTCRRSGRKKPHHLKSIGIKTYGLTTAPVRVGRLSTWESNFTIVHIKSF